ncbi:RNA recognition domain-containing protein [Encephalitozoon hellem]|uniref:Nuclear cap-binding protein subunit n=1 Tax=Encephalitozoon hellem TaxID=27973 RepID=A0A9Q9CAS6_ENCHE|nr:uncharacterized protein EHEL_020460 [Encephalitozoon hellem ATCC 50504]AFM97803.1 hypothetical protein EHEL_020460 [Encephalitozoon hellem ATCC 50504]KAG5859492.1 RNA recognition domain-containing protein [Encephalitozoon hellem]UTX42574.1 nuclear cap-binding protein subunit [Encephalitozoon hellem]WEL38029.1 nuclear cap-binding protein subunit [Encephalitozoon hellem]|eukprot:XP_003886784.1 hypothetical protein EHEL_020460 [Encephalitozoon hellem ATCC 50504]
MEHIDTQILFIRNLPGDISKDKIMELFEEYGTIIQIRIGVEKNTMGTAFVVYDGVESARRAIRHMNGYYLGDRYLNVGYWQPFDKFRFMMWQR